MTDEVDRGNDRASVIFDAQYRGHEETATNDYLIAYCSGDGTLVVKMLRGKSQDRLDYMNATCGDPVKTKNWAFAQWSFETCSAGSWGKILPGNGEIEKLLREYIAREKPRPR